MALRCHAGQFWVTHIRAAAGLLLGLAWDSTSQPSSTPSTVAILAQGTNCAGALLQALFFQRRRQTLQRGKPGSVTLQLLSLRAWLDSLA